MILLSNILYIFSPSIVDRRSSIAMLLKENRKNKKKKNREKYQTLRLRVKSDSPSHTILNLIIHIERHGETTVIIIIILFYSILLIILFYSASLFLLVS